MTTYTVNMADTVLQISTSGKLFFDSQLTGVLYTVDGLTEAKYLINKHFEGIPFRLITLEEVNDKYQRRIMIGLNLMVWCDDKRWHLVKDLMYIPELPVLFDSVEDVKSINDYLSSLGTVYAKPDSLCN